jgi:cobalt-zinc-cadmium resistance protein CzcA
VISLAVSGEYLSVPASVGFIALLGIAVLNGLVMVSYFRQLREGGMPLAEAVREGAQRRLRPVLMTASIAAFGLVPLLFATGPGRNPEAAGHRGDRRAGHLDPADADPAAHPL